jgi:UDPglucose 6-dehydrogenase
MGSDPRIGRQFLDAGIGYGGYCLPKDLVALERLADRLGYDFPLLREVSRINDEAAETVFRKVESALWNLERKRVALLGLAFKPKTDDVRFAPALTLARRLLEAGADVVGFDPKAGPNAGDELPRLAIADTAYDALEGAHCAVVCTEWPEFASLDLPRVKDAMAFPIVVDARNVLDERAMLDCGFTYIATGRPPSRETLTVL